MSETEKGNENLMPIVITIGRVGVLSSYAVHG